MYCWKYRGYLFGVKGPERELDHSHSTDFKVINKWRYTSTSPPSLHFVDREGFIFMEHS
jgi:hypothetical protein